MQDTFRSGLRGVLFGCIVLGFLVIGFLYGKAIGEANANTEYELGYNAGWKEALYKRPVNEELEMVCLGLWFGSLAESK